ncbi:MAG: phosphoribosyltransferase family protein [Parafannyhessea sp.]|uniref:phosphoribosyltransferase family protein n=1 Tax=Parafannyhessea sp. TaxID=2847324 RepID=UPI003F0716DE
MWGVTDGALWGLADGMAELLWPTRCVGCDMPGELLCADCRAALPWIDQRWACPVCGAPFGWLTCTECARDWELAGTVCCLPFAGLAARMVTCYKDEGEKRLAPVIAAAMLTSLDEASSWPGADGGPRFDACAYDGVCFVPATAEAYARRGFDHMECVAALFARGAGLPLADVLVRRSARDQRELGRDERAANLAGTVGVVEDVRGLRLLLVDDVITTGATVREAARALLARGALAVSACSLARVW